MAKTHRKKGDRSRSREPKKPAQSSLRMDPPPATPPPSAALVSPSAVAVHPPMDVGMHCSKEKTKKLPKSGEMPTPPVQQSKIVSLWTPQSADSTVDGSRVSSRTSMVNGLQQEKAGLPLLPTELPIPVAKKLVEEWCYRIFQKGVEAISAEYKPAETSYPDEAIKTFKANKSANRYFNTVCLEATRVVVPTVGDSSDYYHGNYISFFEGKPRQYICAQGPMANTAVQFWRMVLAEKITCIVMLCDLVEKGVEKCHRYYPQENAEILTFDKIRVVNRGISTFGGIEPMVIETTLIEVSDGETSFTLRHFHWVAWPDHSVPSGTTAPVKLLSHIKAQGMKALIHCSAGVGRTGTVLFVLVVVEMLKKGEHPDMAVVLAKLREQRAHCVQNELQYLYAHRVILDYFHAKNVVKDKEKLDKFVKDYEAYILEKRKRRLKFKKESGCV